MRYIGNKTKLLDFIGSVLEHEGIQSGRAFEGFSGTASVGRYLKGRGFAVASCDIMSYSYVFQKAYIELDRAPSFAALFRGDPDLKRAAASGELQRRVDDRFGSQHDLFGAGMAWAALKQVLVYLDSCLPALSSFVTRHYAPQSQEAADETNRRMFFTTRNARMIDAVRTRIHEWRVDGLVDEDEYFLLLACLLEAADAVANTTGVYAAFVKSWQSNALRPLEMVVPDLVVGTGLACRAFRGDVNRMITRVEGIDLLYLDPPYNTRQYSAYYHVPEIIAEGWFESEPELRGKTGLIPDADKKSAWSTTAECVSALSGLLEKADARHVLLSYNSEGLIPEETIRQLFQEFGRRGTFHIYRQEYARYRADRDHAGRQYKGDRVTENIYYVQLDRSPVTPS